MRAELSTAPLGVYDETSFEASGLTWKTWGRRARASGPITHCVLEYQPCETNVGTVELGGLARWTCAYEVAPYEMYTRVRFRVRRSDGVASTPWIDLTAQQPGC